MGQATADLPDLPDVPATPVPNADELLSQLAGEEIDRLLAESETGAHPAPAAALPAGGTSTAASPRDAVDEQLDALFRELTSHNPKPPDRSSASGAQVGDVDAILKTPAPDCRPEQPVQAQLDALFNELASSTTGAAVESLDNAIEQSARAQLHTPAIEREAHDAQPALDEPAQALSASKIVEQSLADVASAIEVDDGIDRSALMRDASDDAAKPAENAEDELDRPLPILLRPLEWMNVPFARIPEDLREAMGKAAIVTTLNSVAILIYVVFFRT